MLQFFWGENNMLEVFNGDCLVVLQILINKGYLFDAIICDPPYGTTPAECDKVVSFELMWKLLKQLRKPTCPIILFGNEPFSSYLRLSNINEFKYDWVWEKSKAGSAITAKYRPLAKHEMISVFGPNGGKVSYYPQKTQGEPYKRVHKHTMASKSNNHKVGLNNKDFIHISDGMRHPGTVQFFAQKWRKQDQIHPHQKPVELMEFLIKSYTLEGDKILDFTMGSGTTLLAAKNLNREAVGIERDNTYFNIACTRLGIENNGKSYGSIN